MIRRVRQAPTPAEILAENKRLRALLAAQREEMMAMAAALHRHQMATLRKPLPPHLDTLPARPPRTDTRADLSPEDRLAIAKLCMEGYPRNAVARAFGVCNVTVHNAIHWAAEQGEVL